MKYDIEANILSWELSEGEISHAHEFGNFIMHFSETGKPLLIEMLNASSFIGQIDKIKNIKNINQVKKIVTLN